MSSFPPSPRRAPVSATSGCQCTSAVLIAALLAGCSGAEAVGTYVSDEPSVRANVQRDAFSGKPAVAAELEALVQLYTLTVTLHPDGTVGIKTIADEFFDCGRWRQDGSRVEFDVDMTGEPMQIRAAVDADWLRLQMPLAQGHLEVPLRRTK